MSNIIVFITKNVRANAARRTSVCSFLLRKDFNHILYKKLESELQYNGDNFCVSCNARRFTIATVLAVLKRVELLLLPQ
jgi:phospholipid N-methyltransferase